MTERQKSNTWITALCVCCACLVTAQPGRSADTVVAILPGVGAAAPPEQVVVQWEVACSQTSGLALVERTLIRKVLTEQALAAGGMAGTNSITLGRLVAADLFVFLDLLPGTNAICRTRAVEATTGLLLGEELWDVQAAPEAPARITYFVRAAAAKRVVPWADRHFVGLLGVRSEESSRRLDETARTLDFLVSEALSAEPRVIVLDREHLDHLRTEWELTDIEQRIKKSAHVLNVGLRMVPEKERLSAAIVLQSLTGGRTLTTNVVVSAQNLSDARRRIVGAVSVLLRFESAPTAMTQGDVQAEARVFAEQASRWLTWNEAENAARAASAAFALEPSQSNRLLWATALSGQTSLTTILRSRELLSDYYDVHLKAIEELQESNLMLPSLGFAVIPAFVAADDAETTALKEAIMEADDRLFRRRLAHYAKHYDALWNFHFNGSPYWATWRERSQAAHAYYPGRPGKQAELLREAADAFTISPPSKHDGMVTARIAMLGEMMIRGSETAFAKRGDRQLFTQLFQDLTRHRDPCVRLMAHLMLIRLKVEPTQSTRAVCDILLQELTPAHPYRNYWFADNQLFYYIHMLQGISPDAAKVQLLRAIVASDDPAHIDGVMGERVIGWLSELATNNQLEQADNLAKQLIDLCERHSIQHQASPEQEAQTKLIALRQQFAKLMGQSSADKTPTNAAVWNQFEFVKLTLPGETFLSLIESGQIYCVKTATLRTPRGVKTTTTSVEVVSYDLRSGQTIPLGKVHVDKTIAFNRLVRLGDWLIIGEQWNGFVVFSLRKGTGRYITERDGLPGRTIRSLCPFGNHVYISFGEGPWLAKSASVVRYDPRSNAFEIVASARSVTPRNALDGLPFSIAHILPDTKRQCLWLVDDTHQEGTVPTRTVGVWKYDPTQGTMTRLFENHKRAPSDFLATYLRYPVIYSLWNNGEAIGPISGLGLATDMERAKKIIRIVLLSNIHLSDDEQLITELAQKAGACRNAVSLYRNGEEIAQLHQTPDGQPFPKVRESWRVFQGVVVACENNALYWMFEKSQSTVHPPGTPIKFAPGWNDVGSDILEPLANGNR